MTLLRWLLCCTLTAGLLLPAPAALAAGAFTDDDGTTFEPAIEQLAAAGLVEGCAPERFCPDDALDRGEAAAMLSAAFELPASARDFFVDDDEHVHEDAINRLAHAGIIAGCGDDRSCVGQRLRRGQMAALIARAAALPSTRETYFVDAGGAHRGAINRIAAAGITAGCTRSGRRFCPDRDVRRAELAMFMARALDLVPRATLREQLAERTRRRAEQARRAAERRAEQRRKAEQRAEQRRKAEQRAERRRKAEQAKKRRAADRVWDRLAACESGGNWRINTGNGYYGGLQFSLASWRAVGGRGYPHQASRAEQIKRGKKLKARQGWGAWPSCSRKLGLR